MEGWRVEGGRYPVWVYCTSGSHKYEVHWLLCTGKDDYDGEKMIAVQIEKEMYNGKQPRPTL